MDLKIKAYHAAKELEKRRASVGPVADMSFKQQALFVLDNSRFCAAQTTRRAGKSTGLGYKFFNAARKHKAVMLPYITLTRDSAYNIVWPILRELNEKHKFGAVLTESNLTATLPNQSTIKLFGADQKNFVERLRGIKTPLAALDEGQSFRSHIEMLVDDILTPAIADYKDGQIVVTGTPGPVPKGYFFEVSQGKFGFSNHKWTVYDNPYMPDIKATVDDIKSKKGWDDRNPTFRREWLGEWVADTDALVYKFSRELNVTDEVNVNQDFIYVLGVDLGYDPDPSAFVLCCYHSHDNRLYIISAYKQLEMTVSDVAERIKYYMKQYPTLRIVADLGAQGKMIGEEIKQRYGIPIEASEKHGKAGFIEIMNSDLRKGIVKVLRGTTEDLQDEWMNLIWDSEKEQRVEDSRYDNHLCDAALYAWRYCYNFAATKAPIIIKPNTNESMNSWWDKESEKLIQQLKEEREEWS